MLTSVPALTRAFLEIARDPRVIPGVHHYCDEWCDQCPLTSRCLAFRCTEAYRRITGRAASESPFHTTDETVTFSRSIAAAEGTPTPELDEIAACRTLPAGFRTDDPLSKTALEYALGVSMCLEFSPEHVHRRRRRPTPAPEEVVLWYHLRIYLKLTRALITRERALAGLKTQNEAAVGLAKLTLVSVQRSRQALTQLRTDKTAKAISGLLTYLDTIERGVDERFPGARAFVRVGIDSPA